jgi:predicted TIM-barrel fold metal-dependent hydrolase
MYSAGDKVVCMVERIVDFHTHVFPDELAPRAVRQLTSRSGERAHTDGTCSGLKSSMQRHGIQRSVTQPVSTRPEQTPTINNFAIQQLNNPMLVPFGTIHPDYADFRTEIQRLREAGIRGVKFHPDYQQFYVDEPRMFPIYEALADAGLIGLFHTGVDIGLGPPYHGTPDRMAKVLDAFPQWTVVAAHFGGFQMWDDVERFLIGRSIYLETSYTLAWFDNARFVQMARNHGVSRVLFGTDSPWADQGEEIGLLKRCGLDAGELETVFYRNAARLLGMDKNTI